jgi:membrane protein YqaA with SNARE-associated domain
MIQMSNNKSNSNLAVQTLVNLSLFIVFFLCIGFLFQDNLERLAVFVIDKIGLVGMIIIILFVESFPTPIGAPIIMYIAIQGGYSPYEVGGFACIASVLGGHIGYWMGYLWGIPKSIMKQLKNRWPNMEDKIEEKGPIGIALLSLAPIPLAFLTWPSGSLRMPYDGFSIAILMRIPKQLLYMLSIVGSIALTG